MTVEDGDDRGSNIAAIIGGVVGGGVLLLTIIGRLSLAMITTDSLLHLLLTRCSSSTTCTLVCTFLVSS